MRSYTTDRFRKLLKSLPEQIQRQSKVAYKRFKKNPEHPGLRFKQIHAITPIYSVRISRDFRAVGIRDKSDIVWFWIGSHTDYEELISRI